MAIDFPNSPSDQDTFDAANITFVYSAAKNQWSPQNPAGSSYSDSNVDTHLNTSTAANNQILSWNGSDYDWVEDGGGGITVYATINDLPLSGPSTGDQAFVSGNNRLYLWNGTGWYNIALINTTPSISGADSSYVLASDGTPTIVTITASDPEGLPIAYSIASDTSGNTATVTSNNNIFTVTPSTNQGDAGTFSLTFRASDGVNIASAISEFTLQFSIQNSNYTTALITSVGTNNQVNNTFTDSSTNSHTITTAGNVTQNTFSPYRHGGYSTYFDGTGDYLLMSSSAAFAPGTGDFTLEAWIYPTAAWGTWNGIFSVNNSGAIFFGGLDSGFGLRASAVTNIVSSTDPVLNTWTHVAATRSGTTVRLFYNGVLKDTQTSSQDFSAGNLYIGSSVSSETFTGYIADARIIKGTAVYTSAFTPPTERLTAITNTSLLACHLPYIADDSTNNHSITVNGNTKTEPFSPYDYNETYSATNNGGSIYYDGTGDNTYVANHSSFDIGSGDFTIETWFYSSNPDNGFMFGKGDGVSASGTSFWLSGGSGSGLYLFHGGSSTVMQTGALPVNQWTHLAFVRNGTNLSTYINGKSVHSTTASITVNTTSNQLDIGYYATAWTGSLADFRFVKGTAVYTADFTPPTAPLTAITNTSLLLKGTNAGIIDKSQAAKSITLNGDVKSSTTQTKYLTSSMYFDGSGDYLTSPDNDLYEMGSADFTVELWVYCTGDTGTWQALVGKGAAGTYSPFTLYRNSDGNGYLYGSTNGTSWAVSNSFGALSTNTWYHLALTRSGNTWTVYKDGVSSYSTTISGSVYNNSTALGIGGRSDNTELFQGYISDVRITKGLARYTANFTPPSAALQG